MHESQYRNSFSNRFETTAARMSDNKNKFDPNTDIPDLSGKVYVVTGGSAGIGGSEALKKSAKGEFSANEEKATASAPIFYNITVLSSTCSARRKST